MYTPRMFHPGFFFFYLFYMIYVSINASSPFYFLKIIMWLSIQRELTSIYYLKTYYSLSVRKVNKILSGSKRNFLITE